MRRLGACPPRTALAWSVQQSRHAVIHTSPLHENCFVRLISKLANNILINACTRIAILASDVASAMIFATNAVLRRCAVLSVVERWERAATARGLRMSRPYRPTAYPTRHTAANKKLRTAWASSHSRCLRQAKLGRAHWRAQAQQKASFAIQARIVAWTRSSECKVPTKR